jgi:tetratricopeptide (TPR) repeat protein
MAECEHLARTSSYFDGALSPAEEEVAARHLAGCARCQALLADAVGIDAVLGGTAPAAARRRRSRWPLVGAALAVAAAAALWIGLSRPDPAAPPAVAIELPAQRALEARFTGPRFGPHRALGVLRGDRAREPISLAALAELERRAELHDLVAALAATGNTARAAELAAGLPASASAESDRAALALAAGDLERALRHAYRAVDLEPGLAAARWNLALAARGLGLARVARVELERVAAAAEPGWADEARLLAGGLARDVAAEDAMVDVVARGTAMTGGGAPLTAADVAVAPGQARAAFLDAARVAPDRARLDALRPLAAALDAHAGTRHAQAMLDRADPALGARFGGAYRTLMDFTATAADAAKVLAELRAAGPRAGYLLAGGLILTSHHRPVRPPWWPELEAATAPWKDPWFELAVERARIYATWHPDDVGARPALEAALARCTGAALSMRCGNLALDLAKVLAFTGRDDLAEARANEAAARLREAGTRPGYLRARAFVAELHRRGGAAARARAEFEEVVLAAPEDCDLTRYARIGQAGLAAADGAWDAARTLLPPPEPPAGCTETHDVIGLSTAVDLARRTGDPRDAQVARRWIERTGRPAQGGFALVGLVRISRGIDAGAAQRLADWARIEVNSDKAEVRAARAWGLATLISDAGVRERWAEVIAYAALEHPAAAQARCALVASVDLDEVTVAARVEAAHVGSHRRVAPADLAAAPIVPDAVAEALAGCAEVAVIARPPLHARADLLPAKLAWWFAGDTPGTAPRDPAARGRSLEVTDPRPPDPSLPRLSLAPSGERFDAAIAGADATPARVLAALADASYAELHVHGIASSLDGDAAYLALSPDPDGAFALRATEVRASKLRGAPLVVLGACRGAAAAPYLRQRWTLPDAFLAAGASAVVAVDVPIGDASSRRVFDDLHRRIDRGEPVAQAVAAIRAAAPADAAWARRLMVFR